MQTQSNKLDLLNNFFMKDAKENVEDDELTEDQRKDLEPSGRRMQENSYQRKNI